MTLRAKRAEGFETFEHASQFFSTTPSVFCLASCLLSQLQSNKKKRGMEIGCLALILCALLSIVFGLIGPKHRINFFVGHRQLRMVCIYASRKSRF